MQPLPEFPEDDGGGAAYIKGVFGALLGNLDAAVAEGEQLFLHTFHFVAKHHGHLFSQAFGQGIQLDAVVHLLHRINPIALLFQHLQAVGRLLVIAPGDALLGTEGSLVNVAVRRGGADAAKTDTLHTESIASAENRAYVVLAAHIVQHHSQGQFLRRPKLLHRNAVQLIHGKFVCHWVEMIEDRYYREKGLSYAAFEANAEQFLGLDGELHGQFAEDIFGIAVDDETHGALGRDTALLAVEKLVL